MKTIMILAVSLAMTGAAFAQGGSGNGGTSDPRNGTQVNKMSGGSSTNLNGGSAQTIHRSQHLGASTVVPGHKTHWYNGQPGASYWAPGHQKRLYGATSGSRTITTETTTRHRTMGSTHQRTIEPGNTSGTTTHRSE
jgi:hypothetical protein